MREDARVSDRQQTVWPPSDGMANRRRGESDKVSAAVRRTAAWCAADQTQITATFAALSDLKCR